MALIVKKASTTGRGSGTVVTGSPHQVKFEGITKIVSFMAQGVGGTIRIRYTMDLDAVANGGTVLWLDWSHGEADSSKVWSAAFEGGLHVFEVIGDGVYSYAWD